MEDCNNQLVTLALSEYDRLRSIEQEYILIKETPDKFVKIELPFVEYGGKLSYHEFRVTSGLEAVNRLKSNFENSLTNLEDKYKKDIKYCRGIESKYEPLIKLIKEF